MKQTTIIPTKAIVHEQKMRGQKMPVAKYTTFPFVFPDGSAGHFVFLKKTTAPWNPAREIRDIVITFNDN